MRRLPSCQSHILCYENLNREGLQQSSCLEFPLPLRIGASTSEQQTIHQSVARHPPSVLECRLALVGRVHEAQQ
jgi:hypothetical protein